MRRFLKAFKKAGESTIVNLVIEGSSKPVLIQDVQHHYLHDQPIHVDFYAVNMSEKLKAKIPIHFLGESNAVKAMGGTLVKNLTEVEVECLPADLPHAIEVDISQLVTFEDTVRISDLKISDRVKILASPDEMIVATQPPRSEEEMKELEQAPVAEDVTKVEGVVKPEVIAEGEVKEEKAE
jgi:large subunit ribosomal protein L25